MEFLKEFGRIIGIFVIVGLFFAVIHLAFIAAGGLSHVSSIILGG